MSRRFGRCVPGLLAAAVVTLASTASAATVGGKETTSYGIDDQGNLLVPAGPFRSCPGGGIGCLSEGGPLAVEVARRGTSTPPLGGQLVHSVIVFGETSGTTRVAALTSVGPSSFEVTALSRELPIVPGRNRLSPEIRLAEGDVLALTDVRLLSHDVGEPRATSAISPIGEPGSLVTTTVGPERGQLVARVETESDRDGDGVVDSADHCNGPRTGAICPAEVTLSVLGRPDTLTPGQRGWLEVGMEVSGQEFLAQTMGALVDLSVTPGDTKVGLPGECTELARDPARVAIRCRASYVTSRTRIRPRFALEVTPVRPRAGIVATATLHSLKLRDVDVDVPLVGAAAPATGRVAVRGLDAFRPRLRLLRSRVAGSVRFDVTCPGGWTLTSCPVDLRLADTRGNAVGRRSGISIRPGGRRVVAVTLRPAARRALRRRRTLRVRATVVRSDVAGRRVRDVRSFTLRAPAGR